MSTLSVNNVTEVGGAPVVTGGVLDSGSLPTGTVLQVVSTTKTDTFTASIGINGFSSDITGLTASITPSTTSSKIYVMATVETSNSTSSYVALRLMRDGSAISVGDLVGSRPQLTGRAYGHNVSDAMVAIPVNFLDSPATTSSVTYSIQLHNQAGSTTTYYVNRNGVDSDGRIGGRTVSSITLMEVAG